MKKDYACGGNKGKTVKSDCWVGLLLKESGGITINLKSKVKVLFGESIERTIREVLDFYQVNNAAVEVEDFGALPFVLMARLEGVIRRLGIDAGKRYIPKPLYLLKKSSRTKQRRSRLYRPGNQPKFFINAALHKPDGVILDLEDSVSPGNKDLARILVRNALHSIDFLETERMVRINQLPMGLIDLEEIIGCNPNLILIPKVETPRQIAEVERKIIELRGKEKEEPYFMPIVESALGIINAYKIAVASKQNVALAIGLEDYTADIGTLRTDEGRESFFARSMVVNAAKAAGIQAIDTVYSDVKNMDGLRESVREAKMLGSTVRGVFTPGR